MSAAREPAAWTGLPEYEIGHPRYHTLSRAELLALQEERLLRQVACT